MSTEALQLTFDRPEIAPYLHPARWDGHTLGQGEIDNSSTPMGLDPEARAFAAATITRYLQDPRGRLAHATLTSGDVFDPAHYEIGTIVAFREELLIGLALGQTIDTSAVDPAPINLGIPPGKHFESEYIRGRVEGCSKDVAYRSAAVWGVIARPRSTPAMIAVIPNQIQGKPPTAFATEAGPEYEGRLVIGQTQHGKAFEHESLSRINRLEVCTYGAYVPLRS